MDKNWRPKNWNHLKDGIVKNTPVVFSPSGGYQGNQIDQIIEKVASKMVEEWLKEMEDAKT